MVPLIFFCVDNRRNRLFEDRAIKLVYAHFNVRMLRKVRAVRLRRFRLRARLRRTWFVVQDEKEDVDSEDSD